MYFKKYKFIICILTILVSFLSCKKEKVDGINNCCCPILETPAPEIIPQRLDDILANGFFIMRKYYTINSTSITLDSSINKAFETIRNDGVIRYYDNPPTSFDGKYFFVDSVKINNIHFKDVIPWFSGIYVDSTNTDFSLPRHYQFYGDTSLFDNIDYIDNNQIPIYIGYNSLPDSVEYNKDFFVNIGNRANVMESYFVIKTARFGNVPIYSSYVKNDVNSFTIPTDDLPYDWHKDLVSITLTLRNWSSIKIKGRNYYFVSEHIYRKN